MSEKFEQDQEQNPISDEKYKGNRTWQEAFENEEIEKNVAEILLEEDGKEKSKNREYINLEQLKFWNNMGYLIEESDGSDKYSIIVLGESHMDEDQWEKQMELVKLVKPEYVLHEWLGGLIYNPEIGKFEGDDPGHKDYASDLIKTNNPNIGSHGLPAKLYDLSKEFNFKIVGCDLTKNEMQRVEEVFKEEETGIKKEGFYMPGTGKNIIRVRDMVMVDKILEYQNKSDKPIIVIIGYEHGNNINSQHLLQERGAFGYIYINQSHFKNKK
ncbi:MAG: hypothetical protein A3C58_02240 [Candidatus Staskawiczbacteria bacterium RIFCSPHIGHO2_02_FULL_34_10]|uniref:Haem-binding uptake Tiki superfamily ChaN domain-containing protein n=1 Tax=Candidatus Staskawiczbacteria bacterium RIFCSPHIGHO2_02_FULL_34_10 TaxID=1802205 RepID=A0A1G2HY97_9BACT|nr:MAG: hypothetical protein A3C58_02240 [Candidatus Staskawiczbacteria bacterium RIFCSPHIGHO2_02_FULL_34_10]